MAFPVLFLKIECFPQDFSKSHRYADGSEDNFLRMYNFEVYEEKALAFHSLHFFTFSRKSALWKAPETSISLMVWTTTISTDKFWLKEESDLTAYNDRNIS